MLNVFFFLAFGHTAKKEKAEKQTLGEYFSKEKESPQTFHVFYFSGGWFKFLYFPQRPRYKTWFDVSSARWETLFAVQAQRIRKV